MVSQRDLREVWIRTVKDMLGVSEYYVSKKFDRYFKGAAELVSREDIDPERFCRAQIQYAIDMNMVVYPSLLGGQALYRYRAVPDDALYVSQLKEEFKEELEHFVDAAERRGHEYALKDKYYGHTPVFLLFMYRQLHRDPPPEIVEEARAQVRITPLLRDVYPQDFVRENLR